MKYMMLICVEDSAALSPRERAEIPAATEAWVKEMDGSGIRLMGDQLSPSRDATTVRVRNAEVLLADGPFAETKEQIAGFDIIECEDLDQALDVAARHPVAKFGLIEVRPFWQ
ncbi:MAG: YciI family protein [Streptosporangiaceae bacterium]